MTINDFLKTHFPSWRALSTMASACLNTYPSLIWNPCYALVLKKCCLLQKHWAWGSGPGVVVETMGWSAQEPDLDTQTDPLSHPECSRMHQLLTNTAASRALKVKIEFQLQFTNLCTGNFPHTSLAEERLPAALLNRSLINNEDIRRKKWVSKFLVFEVLCMSAKAKHEHMHEHSQR